MFKLVIELTFILYEVQEAVLTQSFNDAHYKLTHVTSSWMHNKYIDQGVNNKQITHSI